MKASLIILLLTSASGMAQNVLLVTDKPAYHAGETMWFHIALQKDTSFTADAALVGTLTRTEVQVSHGAGDGSLRIPEDIKAGQYNLAAGPLTVQLAVSNGAVGSGGLVLPAASPDVPFSGIRLSADRPVYRRREKVNVLVSAVANEAPASVSFSVFRLNAEADEALVPKTFMGLTTISRRPINLTLKNRLSGKSVAGARCFLSVVGQTAGYQAAISDSNGRISFDPQNIYGRQSLLLQTELSEDLVIEVDEWKASEKQSRQNGSVHNAILLAQMVSADVQSVFNGQDQDLLIPSKSDTTAFYGKPEAFYHIPDYARFATMEEVLREYVVEVGLQRRNGVLQPFVYDGLRKKLFTQSPLMFIDGVRILDPKNLMALDPVKLLSIAVVARKYFFGDMVYEGIVDIKSTAGDASACQPPANAVQLPYQGLQSSKTFSAPAYSTQASRDSRLPDFRSTLFWTGQMALPAEITFYTSDLPGKYAMVAQGIAGNGTAITAVEYFEVK